MKVYIYVAIGGFLGAMFRFFVKSITLFDYRGDFPLNTLVINVTGSLILAFILTLALDFLKRNNDVKIGISVGFLGSYTTFSTLCKELAILMSHSKFGTAGLYVTSSVVLGLLCVYVGITSARAVNRVMEKVRN